jgi:hypothetical protein
MSLIGLDDLRLFMLVGMFLLGSLTFILGVAVLIIGVWGQDLRAITAQTSRIAQKGLAEEISGLVGNASNLLNTINSLVQTTTGIGVFLTIAGALLMGLAYWFILQSP